MKVLIIDDNEIRREGLKLLLLGMANNRPSVVESLNREQAIELRGNSNGASLVLFAIDGPNSADWTGLLLKQRQESPQIPVLAYGSSFEESAIHFAQRLGVNGIVYLESISELRKALGLAFSGHRHYSPGVARLLQSKPGEAPHATLSHREMQVLLASAEGTCAKEIAYRLNLSIKTVSVYRCRILQKLNLRGTADMITYALEQGLVKPRTFAARAA